MGHSSYLEFNKTLFKVKNEDRPARRTQGPSPSRATSDYHENPLALELKSLRATVARFQEEAHASAVKLQRHSLDAVRVHERAGHLERENDLLKAELAILRANPHSESATSAKHVQDQLTLSLRRQSQKTALAEETIAAKTAEIAQLKAEVYRAQASSDSAYELAARVRAREEELKAHRREMEVRIELLEDDLRMADKTIKEYAALVRGMEKSTSTQHSSLSNVRDEAQKEHDALVAKHQVDTEYMQTELQAMLTRLEVTIAQLEAEKKAKDALEKELGLAQAEVENHRLDDATAAKMVSRYMQFSQTSTNDLLATLSALKARHEGTLSTLSAQNHQLSLSLASLSAQNDRLRSALDEAGGEVAKEAYGRRREVALRIRMGRREARLVESLRRWVRGAEERLAKLTHAREYEMLAGVVQDARIVLEQIDEGVADAESAGVVSGDGARQFLVDDGMDGLLEELRVEMERRVHLERALAKSYGHDMQPGLGQSDGRKPVAESLIISGDSTPPEVPEKSPMLSSRPNISPPAAALDLPSENHDNSLSPADEETQIDASTTSAVHDTKSPDQIVVAQVNHPSDALHSPIDPGNNPDQVEGKVNSEFVDPDTASQIDITPGREIPSEAAELKRPDSTIAPPSEANHSVDAENRSPLTEPIPFPDDTAAHSSTESARLAALHSDTALANTSSSSSVPSITIASTLSPDHSSPATPADMVDESMQERVISKVPDLEYQMDETQYQPPAVDISSIPTSCPEGVSPEGQVSPVVMSAPPMPAAVLDLASDSAPASGAAEQAPSPSPLPPPPPPPPPPPLHPLLADLARVTKRYDDLQRAFRDCHLALEGLQAALKDSASGSGSTLSTLPIPPHMLTAAVARLDDYTEDARVELEIRIGDEVLLAKGYEALLLVPGAMSAVSRRDMPHVPGNAEGDDDFDEPVQSEIEKQITEFVAGTDPAVKRARDGLGRKLEDVQHDIAALKRVIFDPDAFAPASAASAPHSSSHSPLSSTTNLALPASPPAQAGGWSSWIRTPALSPSSTATPSLGPAPTFGNIMTAPRLRSSPSSTGLRQQQQQEVSRSRRPSFFGLASGNVSEKEKDPLAVLGLKVPMPSFGFGATSPPSGSAFGFGGPGGGAIGFPGVLSPTSPMSPMIHPAPGGPRSRTVSSTMYMLGLGASATSLPRMPRSVSSPGSASPLASEVKGSEAARSKLSKTVDTEKKTHEHDVKGDSGSETGVDGDNDSDVE